MRRYSEFVLRNRPGVFIAALLADLLLVPAMVQVGWVSFRNKPQAARLTANG